jgi:hypothetical protein
VTLNADLVSSRCAGIEDAVVRLILRNSLPDLRAFAAAVVRLI